MPTIETLTVAIETKTSGFSKGLKIAGAGLAALVAGSVVAGKAASDLNESINKTGEVFGNTTPDIIDWGKAAAEALGMSQTEALDAASNMGLFAQSAGLSGSAVNDFAKEMVGLSGDMASFFNTSPAEAMEAIRSGLAGQSEPLRQYGVFLTEAAVANQALKMGIGKANGELTEGQKILARQALIMQQTGKAQGDFARTSDGLANSQRIASAQFKNLIATIGTALLPLFQALVNAGMQVVEFIQANWGPALEALGGWFTKLWAQIGPFVKIVGGALVDAWHAAQEAFAPIIPDLIRLWDAIRPVAKAIGIVIGVVLVLALKALPFVIKALGFLIRVTIAVDTALLRFARGVGSVVMAVVRFFVRLWEGAKSAFGKVVDFVKDIPSKIKAFFDGAVSWLFNAGKAILQGLWDGLKNLWESVWNWFQDKLEALKSLPQQLLGIGSPSKVFRGYGEAVGEGFHLGLKDAWPDPFEGNMKLSGVAHRGGGRGVGGVTVNVYGSVMTERDLADTIHKALLRSKGRSGALGLA